MANSTILQLAQVTGLTGQEAVELALPSGAPARATVQQIANLGGSTGPTGPTGPAGPLPTQSTLGQILYPQTAAEASVSVTPTYYYYPVWNVLRYGADPTGVADSTTAIQNADKVATVSAATVFFPTGTYKISLPTGASGSSITGGGASWRGASRDSVSLKWSTGTIAPSQSGITWSGLSNFTIEEMGFDWSQVTVSGSNGNVAFMRFFLNCSQWAIRDCKTTFAGNYILCDFVNDAAYGSNWSITDNLYVNSAPSIHQTQAINIQQSANQHQVCRNICIGTGIFSNAANGLYADNIISGWSFGGGITLGPLNGCQFNRVVNNWCYNSGTAADDNGTYPSGIESWSLYTTIANNHCLNNGGAGVAFGGAFTTIVGNECINNGQSGQTFGGISAYSITGFNASYSVLGENISIDTQVTRTQSYGYAEFNVSGSGVTNILLGPSNQFNSNKTANLLIVSTTPTAAQALGILQPNVASAIIAGGQAQLILGSVANFGIYSGSGPPTISAGLGSLYLRSDGSSTSTRMYVNTNGATGWTNLVSSS